MDTLWLRIVLPRYLREIQVGCVAYNFWVTIADQLFMDYDFKALL